MPEESYRNRVLNRWAYYALVMAVIGAGSMMLYGLIGLLGPTPLIGIIISLTALLTLSVAILLYVGVSLLFKAESNVNRMYQTLLDQMEVVRRLEPQVKVMADNSQISEMTKSMANREREAEALRQAIREEMYAGDWEAATYLVEQMEQRFGYRKEAESLRQEMAAVREMTIEEKIGEAIGRIEKMMEEYRWARASQEMERLMKLFPHHERIQNLPAELNTRRLARKDDLLKQWHAAVQRDEIDKGISLLTELDQYLSRQEARELAESARHVFKARLLNLGVQFSLAVQEHRWKDALDIGVQIREEFPNSRMAKEVSEKIEILRMRAGFVAQQGGTGQPTPTASQAANSPTPVRPTQPPSPPTA